MSHITNEADSLTIALEVGARVARACFAGERLPLFCWHEDPLWYASDREAVNAAAESTLAALVAETGRAPATPLPVDLAHALSFEEQNELAHREGRDLALAEDFRSPLAERLLAGSPWGDRPAARDPRIEIAFYDSYAREKADRRAGRLAATIGDASTPTVERECAAAELEAIEKCGWGREREAVLRRLRPVREAAALLTIALANERCTRACHADGTSTAARVAMRERATARAQARLDAARARAFDSRDAVPAPAESASRIRRTRTRKAA